MILLLLACTPPPECDSGPTVEWANFADGFFGTYCRACHSVSAPDRHSAPDDVNFDTEEEVLARAEDVTARVADGTMPPGGGITEEDLVLIARYLECGG